MTFNSNEDQNNNSAWNPFLPTKKDIERTERLASKSPFVAGFLTFLFPLAAMCYLNRGVNNLKILGYVVLVSFTLGIMSVNKSNQESEAMGESVGIFGLIAMITENTRAVTLARKRQSEIDF
ncbi:MAG: hypothetical protein WBA07_27035 [Rivularia sp. (in: cyanobacteria)]